MLNPPIHGTRGKEIKSDTIHSYSYPRTHPRNTLRTSAGRVVAAVIAATGDVHISEDKVGAAAVTAEDVVVLAVAHGTGDVDESDVLDLNAVGRVAGGTAVLVVLLDVDAVVGDAGQGDILVADVVDLYNYFSVVSVYVLMMGVLWFGAGD